MSLIGTGTPVGRPGGAGTVKTAKDKGKDVAILTLMRQRFEHVCTADTDNRESYVKNVTISSSANQWDEEVKKRRGSNRPALTFNLLNLVVKQIIGDYRQNKMTIKVLPSGGPATDDVADILAGIIRNIETSSKADQAYTNALECAARGGFGYFRILAEYESDDVFNQKLVIKPIHNPLTVYFDPHAKMLTREDARYCLITEMISKEEFRSQYPEAEEMGWDIVDVNSDNMDDWGDDEQIRVCEYFTKEIKTERLVAFDSGAVIAIEDDKEIEALKQIGWNPVKERQADRINIKWRKCNGSHILEERTFKTKYIPIIPVLGEEVNIEGKTHLRSAVYYGIDAQHSYNYERSTAIERSALAAKAPWIVTQKQIELYRDQWDSANTTPQPYLVHMPDSAMPNGPQRIEPPAPSGADMANSQAAAQDVQRTTGVFDSQLGAKSNVLSGVGLSEQQNQGVTSTVIFSDNLRSAIEQCGRVLIDWIPLIYDRERVTRIINAEDDVEMQAVNQKKENPLMGITEVLNDITVGEYDVVVTAGKAFASRRQEAVEGMLKWAQAFPQQAPLVADQILENMDVPGGDVMAARVKRSLPPQVVNDPDSPEGQHAAQQAQQQQQQQQALQQQLLQSKIQVEQGKNQASMVKSSADVQKANAEVIKAKSDIQIAQIEVQNTKIEHAAGLLDHARAASDSQVKQSQHEVTSSEGSSPSPVSTLSSSAPFGSRPDDIALAHKRDEEKTQMLHALAGHLLAKDQKDSHHAQAMHELVGTLAKSHQDIAQHMARQNEIASAPTEAMRDKTGRIVGSRKAV